VEIALMVEGQNGLNWPRWQRIAQAVEDLGFAGLFRSDHFTNPHSPDLDSLELWVSLTWLASHTSRIKFGSLVTPVSFRQPVFTARMAKDVDNLSGGRLILGVGAGWQEREHHLYGFELLSPQSRFDRFEEGVQVITQLLRSDEPVSFNGHFYQLHDAPLLPRPQKQGRPPLLIGGNGTQRTLPLAARYADEWNAVFLTAGQFAKLNSHLEKLLAENGREPDEVRRSLMTGVIFGRDDRELQRKIAERGKSHDELLRDGMIAGTPAAITDQLGQLAEAGVQRVMLQWLELDDMDGLTALAHTVQRQ
jgi:F420-dependent oxidoreductase-like protein